MAATITEISESSAAVWDALVIFEDTHDEATARAALGAVSAADKALFEECLLEEITKIPVPAKAAPSARAARNAAEAIRTGAHAFEGMILARQGY